MQENYGNNAYKPSFQRNFYGFPSTNKPIIQVNL